MVMDMLADAKAIIRHTDRSEAKTSVIVLSFVVKVDNGKCLREKTPHINRQVNIKSIKEFMATITR